MKAGSLDRKKALSRRSFLRASSAIALGTWAVPGFSLAGLSSSLHFRRSAYTMGSIATITAYCDDRGLAEHAVQQAFREMKNTDRLMSVFDPGSQLSAVNRLAADRAVEVDPGIISVLGSAQAFSALTRGAFAVTVEPLMDLYGFRDDETVRGFPTDRELALALESVGMHNVSFDRRESTVSLKCPLTRLDFGGIAVGYAVDRAAEVLRSQGIESALINHSGDLYAIGAPPGKTGWEVGITDPSNTSGIITTVRIKDQALSTSGNYENFVKSDGHVTGHLLNPRSGRSASGVLSGTVIADTATGADALSTGFFVLGIDETRRIIRQSLRLRFIGVIQKDGGEEVVDVAP